MKLTMFQHVLFGELEPRVWYDCYRNQGTGGRELPDWFYRSQTQPLMTLKPMIKAGALKGRIKDGFPQVMRV